jgi:lactam utilization protein B
MATEGRVEAAGGGEVRVAVRSLCVHGDTTGAVELARAVRAALEGAGVALEPFA